MHLLPFTKIEQFCDNFISSNLSEREVKSNTLFWQLFCWFGCSWILNFEVENPFEVEFWILKFKIFLKLIFEFWSGGGAKFSVIKTKVSRKKVTGCPPPDNALKKYQHLRKECVSASVWRYDQIEGIEENQKVTYEFPSRVKQIHSF